MINSNFLMLSDIVFHPAIVSILNLVVISSIFLISLQICKIKFGLSFYNIISTNILFVIFIVIFFQFTYLFNPYPKIAGKIFVLLLIFFGLICFFYNQSFIKKIYFKPSLKLNYLCIFLLFYFLLSISTITDIDSIDYHLGIPLEWYRNESFSPRYDWLHFRGAGSGEILNLFGLHFGSDNFGQLVQFVGLLIALGVGKIYLEKKNFFIFAILILGCPLLIFLTTTQKYQLFTSSLIFFSLILSIFLNKHFSKLHLITAVFILFFSVTIKVNYILPSVFIYFTCLYSSWKNKEILFLIKISLLSFLIVSLPHFYKNFIFYGDPITPVLEGLKTLPDPVILEFARLEKNFNYLPHDTFLSKVVKIFFTIDPGNISRVVGLGVLPIFFIKFKNLDLDSKFFLSFVMIIFISYIILFIGIGRYYLEVFFVSSLIISIHFEDLKLKKIFFYLIISQSIIVFLCVSYGVFALSPSSISSDQNQKIKTINAEGYDLFEKVNQLIPSNSILYIVNSRSYSFAPRKFVSSYYDNLSRDLGLELNLDEVFKNNNITHVITKNKNFQTNCFSTDYKHRILTHRSSRNPLNSRSKTFFYIYKIEKNGLGSC